MEIREEHQLNPVADEVSAITAVVGPILHGVLYSLKGEVAGQLGGYNTIPLFMLARNHRPGDGDAGICFEYAVHDAVRRGEASVQERVEDALKLCKIPGSSQASILFGAEKSGKQTLIDTAQELLTSDSRLMTGRVGHPPLLKRHIAAATTAFRTRGAKSRLPQSIGGLWKADLFLGNSDSDKWVGTTVKINQSALVGARGLRVGLVPTSQGSSDAVRKDDRRDLVICPVPYDGAFVETFYMAWEVVTAFIYADAQLPKEVDLPRPAARQVARYLADRRQFPVVEVIEALKKLAQPELLKTETSSAGLVRAGGTDAEQLVASVLAPTPIGLS
ncbi:MULTISPECIES: hypothetical protein [Cellulosimicrobium]|uniref:hypothetical protein n=1 Tax=Cellulosimicrobium TaxID=157920 RepID=UPI0007B1B94A|nr:MULTISPECIES: hypothetical protein [Cellulosimicrobium]KZM78754.1 hypothetical protein A0J59_11845 [Cellulosimicrobium sp. I38E]